MTTTPDQVSKHASRQFGSLQETLQPHSYIMAKQIDHAAEDEPSAFPISSGGSLARRYEYLLFYLFAIASWALEIAAGCLGSLYGGDDTLFICTVSPFLAAHW